MLEVALVFLRIGLLGFGGPLAAVALMEEETCRKRQWLDGEEFLRIVALCKLLPGPVSTQVAISIGRERAGWLGGVVAGLAFILPAFVIVLALSALYAGGTLFQHSPGFFSGLQVGALAVILLSTWQLARPFSRRVDRWALVALAAALVAWIPRWEPLVIIVLGAFGAGFARKAGSALAMVSVGILKASSSAAAAVGIGLKEAVLPKLFWTCFKAGAFMFGTGIAIVPLLEAEVVGHLGWLSHQQFMDGLAIGQVTPGPIVITSTFIGYLTAGLAGAGSATLGMFLPSFVNVLVILPRIARRLRGPRGAGFYDWAIPAVVGAILAAFVRMGATALQSPAAVSIFIGVLALGLMVRRMPAWLLIPLAGVVGMVLMS